MAAFGQGGEQNTLPGRGYPQSGVDKPRGRLAQFFGGARGPAALPSRTTVPNGPAPPDPRMDGFNLPASGGHLGDGSGSQGPISYHRGIMVEDAGAPRLEFDNVLGHGAIPWRRPVYANSAGRQQYVPPTQLPSWSADMQCAPNGPAVPIPVQNKRIGSFTNREEFGSTRQFFPGYSLADYVNQIPTGMFQQGRRWVSQSKTQNPILMNLAAYATAGSYGQTTAVLPTSPGNLPPASPYGSY